MESGRAASSIHHLHPLGVVVPRAANKKVVMNVHERFQEESVGNSGSMTFNTLRTMFFAGSFSMKKQYYLHAGTERTRS